MSEAVPLKILVIEDDEDTRANLQDILELDHHVVVTASSIAEAMGRSDLATVSVIVSDRRLPDGNAEELIPKLKQVIPSADIIVVTGHADVESAILALRRGAADYILKPINVDVLRASLARTAKQIELRQAKERSEANYRELIEAVNFMVVILNQGHKIIYANRFAAELTGYSPQELRGRSLSTFLENEYESRAERQLDIVLSGNRATEQEIPIRCRNGDERWILWNVRLLNDFEGAQVLLSVGHEVTERRKLEQRALQSERLAAIGQMVTGLAHESRNALQRSQASLELLRDELVNQSEPLELVDRIQRAQLHLHKLYEEVRSYAAPIVLHRVNTSIVNIWNDTWENLESTRTKKQLTLKETCETADLWCEVDPIALEQVFRNILENAIYVSPNQSEIHIFCRDIILRGQNALEISIRDFGCGMNADQMARIFEPFFTTKTQGTGLGMAIVKRIVEGHGGTVRVKQPQGAGAEVVFTIPRTAR